MPDMTLFLSALRGAHKAHYYITPLLGDLVYSATVSSATATAIAITGGSGTIGNVGRGFRVVILSSGGDYKGTVSVRYSGSITTGSIPIRETSPGSVSIIAGDFVRVYNMLVLADKLVEASADFNPDGVAVSTETSAQRPRVCSGGWDVGRLSSGSYVVYLKGGDSAVVDSTSSTITHLWATTGGTLSSTSDPEPTLTLSAAGYYLVTHTVTDDDNSQTQVQYVPIYVHDENDLPYECLLTSVDGDPASGFRASFELFESATIDDLSDGCAVIVWAEDTLNGVGRAYGAAVDERSHILIAGFLRRDTSRASGGTGLEQVEFEVISPLAKLGELPGFSKVMVNDASPDAWSKTYDLGVFRAIMQLLTHYTNALNMFDLGFTLFTDYDYPAFYLNKSTPLDQVKELADAVDCRFVCDRGGHFEIQRRLELLPLADRGTPVTTITLTTADIIDYECTREHYRPVETYRARGILQGHQSNTPLFARWPATPSTGNQSPVVDKLIAESAADLQERCALRGAYEDRVYFDANNLYRHAPTLRLTLFGAYARIFQFYAEWIAFSGITTLRGVALSDFRWILQSVSENYEGGTATTTVTLQAETAADGASAVDDTPTVDAANAIPVYEPPYTAPITPALTPGMVSYTTSRIALVTANGIAKTSNFQSASPEYALTSWASLSVSGTFLLWIPNGFAAGSGWVVTSTNIYYGSLSTLSFTSKHTFGTASTLASADASFSKQNHFVVVRYLGSSGGMEAVYTTDNSAFTSVTVSSHYTTSGLSVRPACCIDSRGGQGSKVYASAHTTTSSGVGVITDGQLLVSSDYGATWGALSPDADTDIILAQNIHIPYGRSGNPVILYNRGIDFTATGTRLYRRIDSTDADIAPNDGTYRYAPFASRNSIATAITNPNRGLFVLVSATSGAGYSAFLTNDLLATSPTWITIEANTDYRGCALAGDNPNVGWLWGTSNAIAQIGISGATVTEQDKSGNLASLSVGDIEAIAGY